MSDKHYFGSKALLSELQSNYASHMRSVFKGLTRGLKGSKAKHIDIKKFYGLTNKALDDRDIESIKAKAKNSELVEIKLRDTKKTLEAYKNSLTIEGKEKENIQQQNIQLFQNLKEAKEKEEILKESMKAMAEYYKIPEQEIIKIIEYCENKVKGKER